MMLFKFTTARWNELGKKADKGDMDIVQILLERACYMGLRVDQFDSYEHLAMAIAGKTTVVDLTNPIIWVHRDAVSMPVNQRCRVLSINSQDRRLVVELCGTGEVTTVDFKDVTGFELRSGSTSVTFSSGKNIRTNS